jgi:hypothetical protein
MASEPKKSRVLGDVKVEITIVTDEKGRPYPMITNFERPDIITPNLEYVQEWGLFDGLDGNEVLLNQIYTRLERALERRPNRTVKAG